MNTFTLHSQNKYSLKPRFKISIEPVKKLLAPLFMRRNGLLLRSD